MTEPSALIDLTYTKTGHTATITLDRPDARNAYSEAMVASLIRAIDRAEDDDDVRSVILTGNGRSFSAGGDLKLMRAHAGMFSGDAVHLRSNYLRGIHRIPRRLARFDKPIIAAINGHAIGAGLDLTCMCDLRIATARARFGSTFVKVGLIPGDGGAYLLSRTIGLPRALDLILTGRIIDAQEALQLGLLHAVVPDGDDLLAAAQQRADLINANAPLAVRLAKSAAYQAHDMTLDQALTLAATYQGIVQNTQDHDEGVQAILDKRAPDFKGTDTP